MTQAQAPLVDTCQRRSHSKGTRHTPLFIGALIMSVISSLLTAGTAQAYLNTTSHIDASLQPMTGARDLMTAPVIQVVNPTSSSSILTTSRTEADKASRWGYTKASDLFKASRSQQAGLVAVHRLYHNERHDFAHESNQNTIQNLVAQGYADQGARFYASAQNGDGLSPVTRFTKGDKHRYALTASEETTLTNSGWAKQGAAFYAAPMSSVQPGPGVQPSSDGKFTIAVFPDTQNECFDRAGSLFAKRTQDIVNKRSPLDIRMVISTGDIVSWGGNEVEAPDPRQWEITSNGFRTLDNAGIPYVIAVGNHDTAIVCQGGSACPSAVGNLPALQNLFRDTHVFERTFANRVANNGSMEGKADNSYATFSAEGAKWLVLSVESTPRRKALDWAKSVVASHPKHNVIIATHYLLNDNGQVPEGMGNMGYGHLPLQSVMNELVLAYPNVRFAFSGHYGDAVVKREDTGVKGNKVVTMMSSLHPNDFNPTRYLTIDVAQGTATSTIRASSIREGLLEEKPDAQLPDYTSHDVTVTGMNFIPE